jgi:hypothetical protein
MFGATIFTWGIIAYDNALGPASGGQLPTLQWDDFVVDADFEKGGTSLTELVLQ